MLPRTSMRTPLAVAVCLLALGCDRLNLGGKDNMVRTMVRGCRQTKFEKSGANCECLMNGLASDLSEPELRLWMKEPALFDEEEIKLLALRYATSCLKPAALARCKTRGMHAEACACVMDKLYDTFTGEQIVDLEERINNGAAVPPDASAIVQACAAELRPR